MEGSRPLTVAGSGGSRRVTARPVTGPAGTACRATTGRIRAPACILALAGLAGVAAACSGPANASSPPPQRSTVGPGGAGGPDRSARRSLPAGPDHRGRSRGSAPATIAVKAVDPGFSGGYQVGDTITVYAAVRDPRAKVASGTVTFRSDDPFDHGCRDVTTEHALAECYLTFYEPGEHSISATYAGRDGTTGTATLRLRLVANTQD